MAGESYTIEDFGGSEENLVIKAIDIDTSIVPGVATVCVAYGGGCDNTQPTPPTILTPPVSFSCQVYLTYTFYCSLA